MNPYQVTRNFESALQEYTGARFAVALNSCTMALLLAVAWYLRDRQLWDTEGNRMKVIKGDTPCAVVGSEVKQCVEIPKRTYVGVPMSIIHAGGHPTFRDEGWRGAYQLKPLPVWDCARRFTSDMYIAGQFQCVSFAASKILAAEQGGAILHDNEQADAWFRRMRFDGRTELVDPHEDVIREIGHHCIMTPSVAAGLLVRLHHLPKHNEDLPDYDYPDLSLMPAFQ